MKIIHPIAGQLNLLEKHADMLINAFSREDMSIYYEKMLLHF